MQNHWDFGRIGRLPVSMHWTVLMAFPWLFLWTRSLLDAAIGTVAFIVLMLAHEFGHVFAARWRKVPVYSIDLQGLHGQTERGYARSARDEVIVAWGGVGAQLLILVATYAVTPLLEQIPSMLFWTIVGPIVLVWTQWNIFLIVVALLPIGPMDGHAAWRVLPMIRDSFRRNRKSGKVVKLSAARRKQLQEDSERKVTEIFDRMKKK